jgi:hypothetical protein
MTPEQEVQFQFIIARIPRSGEVAAVAAKKA